MKQRACGWDILNGGQLGKGYVWCLAVLMIFMGGLGSMPAKAKLAGVSWHSMEVGARGQRCATDSGEQRWGWMTRVKPLEAPQGTRKGEWTLANCRATSSGTMCHLPQWDTLWACSVDASLVLWSFESLSGQEWRQTGQEHTEGFSVPRTGWTFERRYVLNSCIQPTGRILSRLSFEIINLRLKRITVTCLHGESSAAWLQSPRTCTTNTWLRFTEKQKSR